MRTPLLSLSLVVLLALSAVACGGGSSTDSVATAGDESEAAQPSGDADIDTLPGSALDDIDGERPTSFEDLDFSSSPLADFFGFDFSQNEDNQARYAEQQQQAEEIVAICMRDQGFEYQPNAPQSFDTFGPGGEDLPYLSDAWVAKYGFGVTTQAFPQSSVGDLVGYPDEQFLPPTDFVDPNQEYMQSLSETEREAFQRAMIGEPPNFDEQEPGENFDWRPGGCQGEAFDQVFSDGPGGIDFEFIETFGDELDSLDERARSDSRFVSYNAKVIDCVAATGETWVDEDEVRRRFQSQLNEIRPSGSPFSVGPDSASSEAEAINLDDLSERELEEMFRDSQRLDPADIPVLAALQAEEIALATTVLGCGGGPLNEEFVLMNIRAQYEQEFLDTNAEALAEYKPD